MRDWAALSGVSGAVTKSGGAALNLQNKADEGGENDPNRNSSLKKAQMKLNSQNSLITFCGFPTMTEPFHITHNAALRLHVKTYEAVVGGVISPNSPSTLLQTSLECDEH